MLYSELCKQLNTHSARLWEALEKQQHQLEMIRVQASLLTAMTLSHWQANAIDVANVERSIERQRFSALSTSYEKVWCHMRLAHWCQLGPLVSAWPNGVSLAQCCQLGPMVSASPTLLITLCRASIESDSM